MAGPKPRQAVRLELSAVVEALGARLVGAPGGAALTGVCTDTRALRPGDLFVALVGDRFDGHRFLQTAADGGASALLVASGSEPIQRWGAGAAPPAPLVIVPDTRRALGALGRWHRRRHSARVVAVTGSNGKTTTKELLAGALAPFGPTPRTMGNFNNEVGLPLALLGLQPQHAYAVIEMGTSGPGEIAALAALAEPSVGVITCVAAAHTAGLGDVDGVARAKGELYGALPPSGVSVVNVDDPRVVGQAPRGPARQVGFGRAPGATVRILSACASAGPGLGAAGVLEVGGDQLPIGTRLLGRHNIHNAAAALAAIVALDLDVAPAAAALADVPAPPHRMALSRVADLVVLDDAYNANPQSALAALETLAALAEGLPHNTQAGIVLGDMLELGSSSEQEHRRVGRRVAELGLSLLVTMGEQAARAGAAASEAGAPLVLRADDAEHAAALVHGWACAGSHLLLKGSRGAAVERVLAPLRKLREGI